MTKWWKAGFEYAKNKDDETIIVDIDMFWHDDPSRVINYPIKEGQFASMPRWWAKDKMKDCPISGNFYKFKSHEFKHVAEIYKKHYHYFLNILVYVERIKYH